ncbi:cystathionine beta-lyase [Croceicoccus naphthovorans]|uniref:Cystathionine beta-lyase n=1 Tax=Croceicoccus naphthovorans TaxID=1348774 RepID=A0A0G3XGN6_9SPHN|nr:cystathionine beta-lyase [Croceicoccus naphthovorans]AKM10690.1 cystathionine beta-lyase [Croceicoccus naphthovorans]MBB3992178.1 cystathionine beta-lyase [Croceicoccus naphthovorans]
MSDSDDLKPATRLVTGGRRAEWTGIPGQANRVVNPAVWRASTHLYPDAAAMAEGPKTNEDGKLFYGRRGAPTQWALAEALTALEPGAHGTILYPSGVAAINGALMAVLRPGDRVLITDNAYDPTRKMGLGLLKDFGIETRFFDPLDIEAYRALVAEGAKAVFLEAPGSLSFEVCDLPALVGIAKEIGAWTILDNTWSGPTGLAALAMGIDCTVNALTKHVGGHSDLMMGAATGTERMYRRLRMRSQQMGIVVSPDDAALALRGLRTLDVRLKRESESALAVAQWLTRRKEVAAVLCPMLPGAPGHDLWQRDFSGGCGLFAFVLKTTDRDARAQFVDALALFGLGYSWGGFESLAIPIDPPADRSVSSWPPVGVDPEATLGIRLSIGLEDAGDLIADLAQAFDRMGAAA